MADGDSDSGQHVTRRSRLRLRFDRMENS